jgi:hypothetical protein
LSLSPKSLWKAIKDEAFSYYHFEMNVDSIDGVCEAYGLQKVSILRTFCIKTGVQVLTTKTFFSNHIEQYVIDFNHFFNDELVIEIELIPLNSLCLA